AIDRDDHVPALQVVREQEILVQGRTNVTANGRPDLARVLAHGVSFFARRRLPSSVSSSSRSALTRNVAEIAASSSPATTAMVRGEAPFAGASWIAMVGMFSVFIGSVLSFWFNFVPSARTIVFGIYVPCPRASRSH